MNCLPLWVQKKRSVYIATIVDRVTRCLIGWAVLPQRTFETLQDLVDQSPRAHQYFCDGLALYGELYYYTSQHRTVVDKSETYSVEGDNAELCYYLAPLHRSTRCFSKSLDAL